MKRIFRVVCCSMFVLPLSVMAADDKTDFIRYIDRPLQEVQGTRTLTVGGAGEKRLRGDSLSLRLSQSFSYAASDRVMFSNLPWPVLRLLLKSSQSGSTITDGGDAFALSVRFGMTATLGITELFAERLSGFPDDYIRVFPLCEVNARMLLQRWLWAQCDIMASTVSNEAVQGYIYPHAGFQIAKFLYGTIGYRGGFYRFIDQVPHGISQYYRYAYAIDYYHSSTADGGGNAKASFSSVMPVTVGMDIGRHVTATLSTSIGKKTGTFVPFGLQWQFRW